MMLHTNDQQVNNKYSAIFFLWKVSTESGNSFVLKKHNSADALTPSNFLIDIQIDGHILILVFS